ncbi:MAG: anhydro-N-acetylmuramic acid kinase [candidate division Zixibacteria bacterium]|nr:anhydro-N-acetylmuramic acid kinase [candidate division Zixibacteria bacterium]
MSLPRLLKKKRMNVLGLNSGTSADGLDLAVIEIDRSRGRYRTRFLAGRTRKYPADLRRLILNIADSKTTSLDDLIRLDQALGMFCGHTAALFVRNLRKQEIRIDAIASHGQTVRHIPQAKKITGQLVRGTLQIGNQEQVSALTDRVVVGDFRQADIALGGEGAPITIAAMQRLFSSPDESRLIVNIGGIANFFYFPPARSRLLPAASDCGPGNSLSDIICQKLFRVAYDRGGRMASKGRISQRLLTLLYGGAFLDRTTVSTGRELFGIELAESIIKQGRKLKLSKSDILATTAELTAVSIADHIRIFIDRDSRLHKLYLTGGGVHNKFFIRRLREQFDKIGVVSITALGFNPDLVEASAYAVMGEACLRSEELPTCFDRVDRSNRNPILGRIAQPPRKRNR